MKTWLAVNDKSAFTSTAEIKGLYAKAQIIVCIVIKYEPVIISLSFDNRLNKSAFIYEIFCREMLPSLTEFTGDTGE